MRLNRWMAAFFIVIFMTALLAIPIQACTIFMAEEDETVLAGNNEDWMYSWETSMIISAPEEGAYGRVCFYDNSYVQGGMNECGLFYDGATCPASKVPHDAAKEQLGMNFGEQLLSSCATVDEAITMLEGANIPSGFSDHLLIADASGDSAVLEWVEGSLNIIHKDKDYQLVTNFWLTDPSLGWYPCERFAMAEKALQSGAPSVEGFADILNATKQDWGDGGTLYSNVYNLTSREVYVFGKGDFTKAYRVNLTEQLQKLQPGEEIKTDIKDLGFDTPITIKSVSTVSSTTVSETTQDELPLKAEAARSVASEPAAIPLQENVVHTVPWYLWVLAVAALLSLIAAIWRIAEKRRH